MNQIAIFANGDISTTNFHLPPNAFTIAADGGARHCIKHGITPQIVIGDFDSLTNNDIAYLEDNGAELIKYPAEKDETDLELALDYAKGLGAKEITLYGLLGGRWDMTFANLLLLAAPQYAGINFQIIDENTTAYILRGGESLNLQSQPGTTVSAIPLERETSGITYKGLHWSLENDTLPFGTPRGISNIMTGAEAQISIKEGVLLIFMIAGADS